MPYIAQSQRDQLNFVGPSGIANSGELNYWLTLLVHEYWNNNGSNYQAYNDILGALEGCKLELYRRYIADYEDAAKERNGDV